MELYYAEPGQVSATHVRLTGDEARHAALVMRHRAGERLLVTDGEGLEYRVVIESVSSAIVNCRIIARVRKPREPLASVTLAVGVLKGPRFALLVEKATELGVTEIIPVRSARSLNAMAGDEKLHRLRRIAVAGMKSAERSVRPLIRTPHTLDEVLRLGPGYHRTLIAYEGETRRRLGDVLTTRVKRVIVLVGPEGGFEPAEVERAVKQGFEPFSLGPRRLRAETAAITALALVLYQLGEL